MSILKKRTNPVTRHERGKRWATATLVICASFSIWANIRSGQMNMESGITSVFPPIVAFVGSHLISYFNPRTIGQKVIIYGGFGLVTLIAMYGSGWHIYEYVVQNGQHWTTAISYIFITDAPMLFAAAILIQKVSTSQTSPSRANSSSPAKKATPAKATSKATAPKRTSAPKAKIGPSQPNFVVPSILEDPLEKDMLTA